MSRGKPPIPPSRQPRHRLLYCLRHPNEPGAMNVGLCGLPQSGKTTLFDLLTGARHEAHPGKVEVNVEVTPVADERLGWLWSLEGEGKLTRAQVTYLDVAGLARGQGGGSVAGGFVNELRRADALLVVL